MLMWRKVVVCRVEKRKNPLWSLYDRKISGTGSSRGPETSRSDHGLVVPERWSSGDFKRFRQTEKWVMILLRGKSLCIFSRTVEVLNRSLSQITTVSWTFPSTPWPTLWCKRIVQVPNPHLIYKVYSKILWYKNMPILCVLCIVTKLTETVSYPLSTSNTSIFRDLAGNWWWYQGQKGICDLYDSLFIKEVKRG